MAPQATTFRTLLPRQEYLMIVKDTSVTGTPGSANEKDISAIFEGLCGLTGVSTAALSLVYRHSTWEF